uniref:DUF7597 domain-containing protein n=1 Tax=Oryza barthii TaxID=65489 RepID=A0A0D3FKB7_9ORYZ
MVPPSPPGGWDFLPGNEIKDQCRLRFGTLVHSSPFYCSSPFKLVVDAPRSSFRLDVSSVALALRACLGGSPAGFSVEHLGDRCFSFLVCNKAVGLWIYNLKSYICRDYHMRFFLWRNGSPNWEFELRSWELEQSKEWTVVSRKGKSTSVKANVPIARVFNRFHVLRSNDPKSATSAAKEPSAAKKPSVHLDPKLRLFSDSNLSYDPKSAFLGSKVSDHAKMGRPNIGLKARGGIKQKTLRVRKCWVKKSAPQSPRLPSLDAAGKSSHPETILVTSMANLQPDPQGLHLHPAGPHRRRRVDTVNFTPSTMRHEQFVLALVHPQLPVDQWDDHRNEIRGFLEQVRHVEVLESYPHPNVVALFQISSPLHRDALVLGLPLDYDGVHQVRFVRHDQGPNWRNAPYNHRGWIMLLDFPMDYITFHNVNQVISTFGELDWWFDDDPLKGRVLARVWYRDLDSVPQFVVWEQPNVPNGQSWTIYVYTMNGEFADVLPPDDDIPPGECPVDPNINLEDAPAWQFGNLQQQNDNAPAQGWGTGMRDKIISNS